MHASLLVTASLVLLACTSSPAAPVATGELGSWTAASPMPTPRANHCSAAVGDWVLAIGGNYASNGGFVKTDEIHAAQLVDGVLGPWQLAGRTPSPVTECAATSDGKNLYIIGGLYDDEADQGQAWTATLDDSGMLGELHPLAPMPNASVTSMEAAVRDGMLLVTDTHVPDDGDVTRTLKTPLPQISWSDARWDFGFRAQAQYAFTDSYAYAIGGYHDPAVGTVADVSVQSLADGAVRTATPLPTPVGFGEAIAVDDWLFVVGGRAQVFGSPGTTNVYAAQVAGDGLVGTWQAVEALPMARTNHELVLLGDYLVLTGGAAMGPGDATVLTAQVRY